MLCVCLLVVVRWLLFAVRCLLFVDCRLRFVVSCSLLVACCVLLVSGCLLVVVCWLCRVLRGSLLDVRCVLFAVVLCVKLYLVCCVVL